MFAGLQQAQYHLEVYSIFVGMGGGDGGGGRLGGQNIYLSEPSN